MVSRRAFGQCPEPANSVDQAKGGARAWKRRCGTAAGMISAFFSNRSRGTTAGIGNVGAAAGRMELAKTMTAQMAQ